MTLNVYHGEPATLHAWCSKNKPQMEGLYVYRIPRGGVELQDARLISLVLQFIDLSAVIKRSVYRSSKNNGLHGKSLR